MMNIQDIKKELLADEEFCNAVYNIVKKKILLDMFDTKIDGEEINPITPPIQEY